MSCVPFLALLFLPSGLAGLDDRVSRLSAIKEGATTLEGYNYLGLNTTVERTHPEPNVNLTYLDPAGGSGPAGDKYIGLDRFGRVADVHWRNPSTSTTTDRFGYGYDRNGNRLYRENLVNAAFSELYHLNGASQGYDGFNQLLAFARGTLNGSKDTIAAPTHYKKWTDGSDNSTLDGLGNWNSVNTNGTTQTRGHNKQNQITSISAPDVTPDYDNNGNTKKDEKGRGLVYDAWDRLVEVLTAPGGARLVRYTYDPLGRRACETTGGLATEKLCTVTGGTLRDFYYSRAWQVVEEREGATPAVKAHYVWSPVYVDALVLRDRDTGGAADLDERLYVQQDANWNVTAVANPSGAVLERYTYDPYGQPTAIDDDWTSYPGGQQAGQLDWHYLHQGGRFFRFDASAGTYHFRNRDLSATLGRWMQQDPAGFVDGMNLYGYEQANPSTLLDPFGEFCYEVGRDFPPSGFGVFVRACYRDEAGCIDASLFGAVSWAPPFLYTVRTIFNWFNIHVDAGIRGGIQGSVRYCRGEPCIRDPRICGRVEVFVRVGHRAWRQRDDLGRWARLRFGFSTAGGAQVCWNPCNGDLTFAGNFTFSFWVHVGNRWFSRQYGGGWSWSTREFVFATTPWAPLRPYCCGPPPLELAPSWTED